MAKAKPAYKDPLSLHHDDEPHALQVSPWPVFAALMLAAVVLAALNSEALVAALEGVEPNAVTETVLPLAYEWNNMMDGLGLTRIGQVIGDFITSLHEQTL